LHIVASSLERTRQSQLVSALFIKSINLYLTRERTEAVVVEVLNLAAHLVGQSQDHRAARLDSLAGRLAEASGDEDQILRAKADLANSHISSGRLREAEVIIAALRETIDKTKVRTTREAHILRLGLLLAFRTGFLSEQIAADYLKQIRALGERFDERQSLGIIARWHQANGKHQAALDVFGDLIALANEIGSQSLPVYEAGRALSLAALGRREEAGRIAKKVDQGKDPPHISLALLYLELGDQAKARARALAGYKEAWGEGPPYHDHWGLEDCRKVLAAIDEPEPVLPSLDPSKVEPFDFEPDVERLIEKTLAERAKAAAEKAKRDAAREAEAAKSANVPKQP
jgi:hypothetical protein